MTLHQRIELVADRPADRLAALQTRLIASGCSVTVDDTVGHIEVSLAAEEASWMRTGCLTALLLAFDDVVHWRPDRWRPHGAQSPAPAGTLGLEA